jgi:hypothetical protein
MEHADNSKGGNIRSATLHLCLLFFSGRLKVLLVECTVSFVFSNTFCSGTHTATTS